MSRIDEAMRRADRTPGEPAATGTDEPSPGPAADAFDAPWQFSIPEVQHAERGFDAPAIPPEGDRPLAVFRGFKPSLLERLAFGQGAKPRVVEQYRRLAATLHHAQADQGIKVLLVTSALAAEGKTLTATNLALTLAESYRRQVLLIDADLRRPALHEVFQIPNVSGLTDGLHAGEDRRLALVQISAYLTVLTAGRPDSDPMHALTSGRMRRILQEAAARFDWVIVDTPPVALLPDANLLAAMVDAALLVIRAGETPYQMIQKAIDAVGRDRIIGTVLNGADDGGPGGYDSYEGYYYTSRVSRPQK